MTPRRGDAGLPPTLKRLGQHFLADAAILRRIADALDLRGDETVVEIGPGRGALTDLLAERAGRVVAIELDRALAAMLRERYADRPHVEIVEADVLTVELARVAGTADFVLAGNVPYYITTPILFHALQAPAPTRAVYLVQREVAERIVAEPGSSAYGALSVNVQARARAELLFAVPAGAFRPPPKVESAVVRVAASSEPVVADHEIDAFRRLVQAAFGLRRKQMRRVLRSVRGLSATDADDALDRVGVAPDRRPETLAPYEFAALLRTLRAAD